MKKSDILRVEILDNDVVMIRAHLSPEEFAKLALGDEGIRVSALSHVRTGYAKAVPCRIGEYDCWYHFRDTPCKGSFPVTYYRA
jgi:hypothetical protein